MTGFFGKLFGGKKKASEASSAEQVIESTLAGIIERGQLDLSFEVKDLGESEDGSKDYQIEFFGEDEGLLTEKEGQLLDALQLYLKRVVQHQLPDDRVNVAFDCNGFREESNKSLVELAEKLKGIALEKGKSVYFRALPPKDRKVIHQYLANDGRVRSRSVGDGLYKKIKIFPVKGAADKVQDTDNI